MATRTYLVVGATGQQGGSVLAALNRLLGSAGTGSPGPIILALTRSASSAKAQGLSSRYPNLDLTVTEGDIRTPKPILSSHPGITSVFLYTSPPSEESQAFPLIDAAASAGVSHIVFSSVDRGGDAQSWKTPTDVGHFLQKHNIELHLRRAAEQSRGKLRYTILRPTAFFDNLNPTSRFGAVFASMWAGMSPSTRLQLVSVHDIGLFGAKALLDPERWDGRAVGLAGQEMTFEQAQEVFRNAAGKELPQSYWIVGKGIRWAIGEVGRMFHFFEQSGYGVDIAKLREEEPELQDFEKWLRESSKFDLERTG
ncbi:uncharacterized protein JN550_003010 [Neoarthrinium moseri]|uniref:uncharacterized protein n=1 Tax=Neoarthrinium moseri TaxID=1658444 RepID=UPI001FDAFC63|nr:uncharacterized protein JN550_003010 [Neoarthrinium moseri]KAI1873741.1 hypothetical protein JN550_003010 [Neoarthrinium moseri]